MDWRGTRDRIDARLADRIRDILLERGRLSAKQIISTLKETSEPQASRHWINSVLYKRRDLFRHAPGPFWKPPQWEAIPAETVVLEAEAPPIPPRIHVIEPIRDRAKAAEVEPKASLEDLGLHRERERRRAAGAASESSATGSTKAVHIVSPTFPLSDKFHWWADSEKSKHNDGEPG